MSRDPAVPHDPRVQMAGERTEMATFRTRLALDRTTLAWVRTALTFGTFGFGLAAFFRALRWSDPSPESARLHMGAVMFGTLLILLGIGSTVIAAASHVHALRKVRRGTVPAVSLLPLSVILALLVAVAGLAGLWALFG